MNLSLFIVALAVGLTCARPENVNEKSEQLDQDLGINDEASWKTSIKTFWQDLKEKLDSKKKKYLVKTKDFTKNAEYFVNGLEFKALHVQEKFNDTINGVVQKLEQSWKEKVKLSEDFTNDVKILAKDAVNNSSLLSELERDIQELKQRLEEKVKEAKVLANDAKEQVKDSVDSSSLLIELKRHIEQLEQQLEEKFNEVEDFAKDVEEKVNYPINGTFTDLEQQWKEKVIEFEDSVNNLIEDVKYAINDLAMDKSRNVIEDIIKDAEDFANDVNAQDKDVADVLSSFEELAQADD
jgi:chromosome segregation ATPase